MSSRRFLIVGIVLGSLSVFSPMAGYAFDEPPINLGFTSFMDGGPPSGPGWYFSQYMQYWNDNQLANSHGGDLQIPVFDENGQIAGTEDDLKLDAWVGLSQFIYQSNEDVFCGGKWGMNLIVPEVWLDLNTGKSDFLNENSFGVGDLWVGPFLQWDPIMGKDGPIFMHRVEFQLIMPTGDYDRDLALNAGSNHFSFDPYWAGTFFFTPKLTASWRLHYLWNDENEDPNPFLYPGADTVQPGQAVHVNFATDYEVIPKTMRVGINGYYMDQITDTKMDGHDVAHSQEKVFAIGPGLLYSMDPNNHLFFNVYFETDAENRAEGERFTLRYVRHF
jgi:hypothetical protein